MAAAEGRSAAPCWKPALTCCHGMAVQARRATEAAQQRELELLCDALTLDDDIVRGRAAELLRSLWELSRRRRPLRERLDRARVLDRLADHDRHDNQRSLLLPDAAEEVKASDGGEPAAATALDGVVSAQEEKAASTPRAVDSEEDEHQQLLLADEDEGTAVQGDVTPTAASLQRTTERARRAGLRPSSSGGVASSGARQSRRRGDGEETKPVRDAGEGRVAETQRDGAVEATSAAVDAAAAQRFTAAAATAALPPLVLCALGERRSSSRDESSAVRRVVTAALAPHSSSPIYRTSINCSQSFEQVQRV